MKTIKKRNSLKIINITMSTSFIEVQMQLLLLVKKRIKKKIKILQEVTDVPTWNHMFLSEFLKI
jgi:hypothetical protein